MISILKKEINLFFSSMIGYIILIVFLLAAGLFIWVFPDTGILDQGYANLDPLFVMAPWFFIFLIPAITMRLFAEEFKTGTIELLATKPLTDLQIVLGKYFASLILVLIALLPTLLYYYTILQLGSPVGNLDVGATWGSYIGLIMLSAGFVAIGLFASSLTDNQVVAFVVGLFLCFFCYIGFDYLSSIGIFIGTFDTFILNLGINEHYNSISRGVVDTRDIIYFLSLILVFLLVTKTVVESRKW